MPAGKPAAPPPAPLIPPLSDGLPWVRFITGLVAVAMLAIPAGWHGAEWTTRPIADRVISAQALPPQPPLPRPRAPDDDSLQSAAPAPQLARATDQERRIAPHETQRTNLRAKVTPLRVRRYAGMRHRVAATMHVARARHGLTRAQVVREYLASREQVAALTREDSGSAYLMRLRARASAR